MAKTESTAVNELIDLVQNGKQQAVPEPAADLFGAPKSTRVSPPRMTSPLPPMRGAGEVEPLPRGRAPHSTSQHSTKLPTPVRMSTADPARGNTIPPISRLTTQPPAPPRTTPRATSQTPAQRPSAPPPPHRASSPRSIQSRATVPSLPSLPPLTAPVAAPFEARSGDKPFGVPQQFPIIGRPQTVDVTGDIVKADNWFDVSAAVHKIDADGTAVVPRPLADNPLSLVKRLAVPMLIVAIIGVAIGGYFALNSGTSKPTKTAAAAPIAEAPKPEARVAMAVAPTEAPPPAVAQPEPPTKAEEVAKQAAAETEAVKAPAETGSMLPAATTAALTHEPAAAIAKKVEAPPAPTKAEPAPTKAEPAPTKAEPAPTKIEVAKTAAAAPAPTKAEPAPADATPVKSVAPSTTPAPVREVQTVRGVVKLVDVRIDSKPSGATVMLVDNGKTSFLGSTPLATSVDPSRKYDVIFTSPGRPTQMAPLDPAKTSRLDVTLARAKSGHHAKKEAPASAPLGDSFIDKAAAPKADTPPPARANPKKTAAIEPEQAAGQGTLMVSSKPPCEIMIDGKATGLTTPQRAIPLSTGAHKVTFVNDAEGIKKTVSVSISADQSTKLIQDLMKK